MTHVVPDLESFYNRQLLNIGGIAEESTWVNRDATKVATKFLLRIEHHASTRNGLSKE